MSKSILILGDLIIDETWYTKVNRLNPEAPVPTAELTRTHPYKNPGGAGFAAAWAASQGMNVFFVSAVARNNLPELAKYNIKVYSPWKNCDLNVTKTRFIDYNSGYHLLRLDNDRLVGNPPTTSENIIEVLEEVVKGNQIDVCLLSDYNKGFFHNKILCFKILNWLQTNEIPTILDTRAKDIRIWSEPGKPITHAWVKLNDREFNQAVETLGWKIAQNNEIFAIKNEVFYKLLVTHGKNGSHSYEIDWPDNPDEEKKPDVLINQAIPHINSNIIPDPTGCGDIFDVTFISALSEGIGTYRALQIAVDTATKFAYIPLKDKFNG